MIIAAVDISISTRNSGYYKDMLFEILSKLEPPIRILYWNDKVKKDVIFYSIDQEIAQFIPGGGTKPYCFIEYLPNDQPIELYIITDGQIETKDVEECSSILEKQNIQFKKIHLYYIGIESDMNLRLIDVFKGNPQAIHINKDYIGCIEPTLIDFNDITLDYIIKDDSFKVTILAKINSPNVDKSELKNQLNLLTCRILQEYFNDKLSIQPFYTQRDVKGCIRYVKEHAYDTRKARFQWKMADILNLFDKNIDTYSVKHFKSTKKYTLTCKPNADEKKDKREKEATFDCKYLTCDSLSQNLLCIPLKICKDAIWPDKIIIQNPFTLLESDALIEQIVSRVESYARLENSEKSSLQDVYLLHNNSMDVQDMIKHNNYVLSTFFQNKLPGKPILWHMVFLYIMALKRFSEKKDIFFEEIRFLGKHDKYFITLVPDLNPPIIEDLNCCFWYLAHVCHKAFPNSEKNVLRKQDFLSGVFLEFYKNVYEEDYTFPPELPEWQLWHMLSRDKKSIFRILTYYFYHEKVNGLEDAYQIILYRGKKPIHSELPKEFKFLSQLDLEKVLDTYAKCLKAKSYFVDEKTMKPAEISLYDEEESKVNMLSHVQINPKTCHPFVTCPITGKYWRDCIGDYNIEKHSYVRLFKRFCENYEMYPENSDELLCFFLNMYVFQCKGEIPEVFDLNTKKEMDQVLEIFKPIINNYSCEEYLKCSNEYFFEEFRKKYESIAV